MWFFVPLRMTSIYVVWLHHVNNRKFYIFFVRVMAFARITKKEKFSTKLKPSEVKKNQSLPACLLASWQIRRRRSTFVAFAKIFIFDIHNSVKSKQFHLLPPSLHVSRCSFTKTINQFNKQHSDRFRWIISLHYYSRRHWFRKNVWEKANCMMASLCPPSLTELISRGKVIVYALVW